ncbi:MAG: CvpA family protein [Bacteroidota bacterium]|nr:CvpA family protein [Bacteroidota bacterium]
MWLDIFLGLILLLSLLDGYKNGFFREVGGLAGLIVGFFVASALNHVIAGHLIVAHSWHVATANMFGFLIPFLAVIVLFVFLSKVFSQLFSMLALGWMNRLAGAFFCFLKGAFILSIMLNLYQLADKDSSLIGKERIERSTFYKPLVKVAPSLFPSFLNASTSHKTDGSKATELKK